MAVQEDLANLDIYLKQLQPNQKLLAVSKLQPIDKIQKLYQQGQTQFAENYVQEALEKIEALKNLNIQWHLIGPLQKNKVKYLKNHFAYIHSVDSYELAELISRKSIENNFRQKIMIQINFSNESSKSGFDESSFEQQWPRLSQLPGVEICGLMTMPPLQNNPEENRIYFKKCYQLGQKYQLKEYSMGTSHDYQVALQEGATWIRLGTLLFGERLLQ